MEITSLDGPSCFLDVLGDTPKNRVLDFLLGEMGYDFTLKEIAEKSGVGYASVRRMWPRIVASKVVKPTRRVGKAVFYEYDLSTKEGRALRNFYLEVLFKEAEKELKKQRLRLPPLSSKN
ncbi:hypothetical protein J4419_02200 [Candidatus Woesearchaeota archaeon]|nr:hypothetical protein [Candidatus Woesearchaeota archaeon]